MNISILHSSIATLAYYLGECSGSTDQYRNWMKARTVLASVIENHSILGDLEEFIKYNSKLGITYSEVLTFFYNKEVRRVLFLFFVDIQEIKDNKRGLIKRLFKKH